MSSTAPSFAPDTLSAFYRETLLENVLPFWLRHGLDRQHGGIMTALDRNGDLLDSDKSIWFQGRAAWMYATAALTYGENEQWCEAAKSCLDFIEKHARAENGKLYFTVTREGAPLRIRRYVYSEAFAAMGNAAMFSLSRKSNYAETAARYLQQYLDYSFMPGKIPAKVDPQTRPLRGIGPYMFAMHTCGIVSEHLGDISANGKTCSEWISWSVDQIEQYFVKPELEVLLETCGANGEILDHFDGRTLNPGHAIECAWFLMHEARKANQPAWIDLGCRILDWMWKRGWDHECGGIFYFRDLRGLPVQEYWHEMKFWWPHNEAIIATLLAYRLTGAEKYRQWFEMVHRWSFTHFADTEYGEWYGYLRRDGSPSVQLKGNMWKGPYHLPRMLWYCDQLLGEWAGA